MQYIIQNNKNHWNHIPKTPLAWKKLQNKTKKKKGHFSHIGNEIKICSQNKCHHHLSNVCENSFRMFHSNWVISDYDSCLAVWISQAESNKLPKQMNGNQKWPSYCETYEMNFHRRWKGDDGIYFGYRFWFHCLYEQSGLFWKLFHANGVFGIWFILQNGNMLNLFHGSPTDIHWLQNKVLSIVTIQFQLK